MTTIAPTPSPSPHPEPAQADAIPGSARHGRGVRSDRAGPSRCRAGSTSPRSGPSCGSRSRGRAGDDACSSSPCSSPCRSSSRSWAGTIRIYQADEVENVLIFGMIFQALVPLTALLFASGMVQDDIEEQTLTYLLIRPVPRWAIYLAKLMATFLVAVVRAVLFTTATLIVIHWDEEDLWKTWCCRRAPLIAALLALPVGLRGDLRRPEPLGAPNPGHRRDLHRRLRGSAGQHRLRVAKRRSCITSGS